MRRDQGRSSGADEVERLLAERGDRLMGLAISLTSERADAEDLLQAALERLVRNWRGVTIDTEAYVRRTLYNLAADGWRRR
ncbi:MAG: sigma factor [Streptosporangiaceae bacterium]